MQSTQSMTPANPPGGGPSGGGRKATWYIDPDGRHRTSRIPVPVDKFGRLAGTAFKCGKCAEPSWLPLNTKDRPVCEVHDRFMEPVPLRRTVRVPVRNMWSASERSLRPVWALPGMAAAGLLVDAPPIPAVVFTVAPLVGEVARRVASRVLTARAAKGVFGDAEDVERYRLLVAELAPQFARGARLVGYGTTAGLAWLGLADLLNACHQSSWTAAALASAGLVAWLPFAGAWWKRLRAERNTPPSTPEPVRIEVRQRSADESDAAEAATTWHREVDISGTELDPATWRRIKGGWQAAIVATKRGALNGLGGDNMAATVRRVAAGFDVPRAAVGWIDEYEGSPNRALLLVQPDSPLRHDIVWQPPGVLPVDEAFLHMGMRIDGSALRTRLWTPGWGAPSRYLVGTKGSGKSEALRLLLLGMLEAQVPSPTGPRRLIAPFLHDPKRGKDFGAFRRQVCGFSTDQETLHLIVDALIREMDRRYDALGSDVWFDELGRAREGETAFDPSVHGPVISLVIDELHEPVKDQALMAKLDPFGRKMRAAGIEIDGASHMSTISDTGSQVFRDMMAGGEAWLFRTTSGLNAALATGGQVTQDPRGLPREPGSTLFASGDEDTMQARTAFVPSEVLYNRLYDDDNRSRIMPVEWPPETLEAFGPEFVQWMRECQEREPGQAAPVIPRPTQSAVAERASVAKPDVRSIDAVLAVLASAETPLDMDTLSAALASNGWSFSTRTVRLALENLRKQGLVEAFGSGKAATHVLTEQGRGETDWQRLERGAA